MVKDRLVKAYSGFSKIKIYVIPLNNEGYSTLPEHIASFVRLRAYKGKDNTGLENDTIGIGVYFGEEDLSSAIVIDTSEESNYSIMSFDIEMAGSFFVAIANTVSWALQYKNIEGKLAVS